MAGFCGVRMFSLSPLQKKEPSNSQNGSNTVDLFDIVETIVVFDS